MTEEFKDKTNLVSNRYLHINSCGKQKGINRKYVILRSRGRVDFHILYIITGCCMAEYEGKEYKLQPGDMVLYKPQQKQLYRFNPGTESYWIHFSGIGAEEILKASGLWTKGVMRIGVSKTVCRLFDEINRELVIKEYPYLVMCEGKLLELIAAISRAINPLGALVNNRRNLIYDVMNDIHAQCQRKIDITKLAKQYGLSKGRFDHLFKEVTGLSPHRYLVKVRLEKAAYLLCNSSLNISEVAELTGFEDPLYFSRTFKKQYFLSPKAYRRAFGES